MKKSEPRLNERDSPQVQNPVSTDNNIGNFISHPPKPTNNLVPSKDDTEGTGSLQPKRTVIKPIRYRGVKIGPLDLSSRQPKQAQFT